LIEHTVAVGTLILETCQLHPRLNPDILLAAALVHDVGKVREFTYGAEFGLTEEGRVLGHVQMGAEVVSAAAGGLDPELKLGLLGCVLTHHGVDQGRRFPSPEAVALYRLNALMHPSRTRWRDNSAGSLGFAFVSVGSGSVTGRQARTTPPECSASRPLPSGQGALRGGRS